MKFAPTENSFLFKLIAESAPFFSPPETYVINADVINSYRFPSEELSILRIKTSLHYRDFLLKVKE